MPEEYKEIVPLTDPVVKDISQPQPPTNIPATPPKKTSKNLIIIPLIIITLLAVVTASLFYFQNQQLKTQVQDLTNTLEAQKTLPTVPVPTLPDVGVSPSATPTATPSATPQTKTEPEQALTLAQEKYKDAQLILITSNNPHLEDQTTTKYWFRQAPGTKKYLYVSFIAGKSNLIDQQVYVSPDNNIPSLNQKLKEGKLGLTQAQILSHANSLCQQPEKCQSADATKLQFLDTGTNLLWQVTYQVEGEAQPILFQIDSLTKEVIYQSQK